MNLPDLPIRAVLPELTRTLAQHGTTILVAPPGTGKTTVVPLALPGRMIVAEPRRLAARAAAARMASLLGEPVGRTVGYAVRGDRKTSKDTRIEVVTSGLLVRRIQHDPELSGVDTVLLDECHERHLDADLLLALLADARALRPDLKLLATSATVAAEPLAVILDNAPVLKVEARTYPTQTTYLPPLRGERPEACVARATRQALSETDGDVLVFLPGAAEINRVRQMLGGVNVVTLHGRLAAKDQDAALQPATGQRVVLATAVAESSLTVPGVRAVVDSGMSRVPRVDHRRGLPGLATVRTSAAVADQRAGRAGREAPGRVYRCWPEHEQSTLPRYPEPEIRVADLTRLALELACWGTPDGSALRWWDAPPEGALKAGQSVLHDLHALNNDGTPTDRGCKMADVGLHPRLARALLDGGKQAADVIALLDDDTLTDNVDLETALRKVKSSQRWRRESQRLAAMVPHTDAPSDPAKVVALAYPERLARRRAAESRVYLMASGTAVELPPGTGLDHREWLAIAIADRKPGEKHGRVRLAAAADLDLATEIIGLSEKDEVFWQGDVVARRTSRLGAITLTEKPLPNPAQTDVEAALRDAIRAEGLSILDWDPKLHARMALLHRALGEPWPAVDQESILSTVEVTGARNRKDLNKINPLRAMLPWPAATRLDELAPERIEVPSGSRIAVDYDGERPVLAVRLQEIFGWRQAPVIADGTVTVQLHLLTPAGRPTAVTDDLESFWANGYPQVRAELRGRYPKHDWPADPLTAIPRSRRRNPR
ncbi:ATP-dependent helicase HrpB [Kibdelosporangium philippinense]|uniref:ATP-dependent helicase HrpB n=1 Tax=Kibdelosporangium philippinense TaxID=211113 RepID=A0ABS8ZK94_9PSEU|nr:ATP-dependent helicase HrpB [Kibdelosporangium philippinense]MCE7008206.1 ATP-dependent helicase HrpB [Kibdelosporangium philippinense]